MTVTCVCCGIGFDHEAHPHHCPGCRAPLTEDAARATYFEASNPAMGEQDPARAALRQTALDDAARFQAQLTGTGSPAARGKGRRRRT